MITLRSAARSLLRERGFTASVVLTLMLGLGGCFAVFSVIRNVLLAPLPFAEPERLVRVWMTNPQQGFEKDVISYPQFRDWRDQSRDVFTAIAVINDSVASLSGNGPAQEIALSQVTEEFFQVLGVQPLLGRVLVPEDYEQGRHRVLVLSFGLWTSSFGADTAIVGRTITLATEPFTVVGVMPPRVVYPADTAAWAPLSATPALRQTMEARGALWLEVIARMKPEIAAASAQAAMDVVQARHNAAYPTASPGTGVYVAPMQRDMVEPVARSLWLLQGAVLAVLLIACANISNLMLARATAREREIATRMALGAGWKRIAQECLIETLLITSVGAMLGIVLAVSVIRIVPTFAPANTPLIDAVSIDGFVAVAAVLLTVVTAIVLGLAPIVRGRRTDVSAAIKDGGRVAYEGGGSGRARLALAAAQIGGALVLLVGAGLLVKSFVNVLSIPTGFTSEPVLTARVSLPTLRYPTQENRRAAFWNELIRRVAELPGVTSAGAVSAILLPPLPVSAPMIPEGRPGLPQAVLTTPVAIDSVQADYFDAIGQPLLHGRRFSETIDAATALPVAIVNETLARTYFGTSDVVGRRVTFSGAITPQTTWLTIVGVVRDVRRAAAGPHVASRAEVYRPYSQRQTVTMVLTARTSGHAIALAGSLREMVRAMDADVPLSRVQTLDTLLGSRVNDRRFLMTLLAAFAALAVLLAATGIYGVIAYTVSRRLPEFGMCLALGAQRLDIARSVLTPAIGVAVGGTVLGVAGALLAARFVSPQLYGVNPNDPWVLAAVAGLLMAIALLAAWIPARRACRVDPMSVLRRG